MLLNAADPPRPRRASLSLWLFVFTLLGCAVLVAAILGSSYTGLSGDWLTADVLLGGEIYLATVGLTDVRLQNERGSQKYGLPQLCKQTGFDSVWCTLDAIGAETETTLTFAFVPAFVVVVLSLLTVLRNCCGMLPCVAGPAATCRRPAVGHVQRADAPLHACLLGADDLGAVPILVAHACDARHGRRVL